MFRVRHNEIDLRDYLENEKNYCPSYLDNICQKFKQELDEKVIKCDDRYATRLKAYLEWKCENEKMLVKLKEIAGPHRAALKERVPAEEQLLPEHIRPESYEVWLIIKKEPIIIGNATITVNLNRYAIGKGLELLPFFL